MSEIAVADVPALEVASDATVTEQIAPVTPETPVADPVAGAVPEVAPGAPVEYALTLPEGVTDNAILEKTTAFARTSGLSNDQAQAVLAYVASESATSVESAKADVIDSYSPGGDAWVAQRDQWEAAVLADPVLGGAHLETTKALAAKVLGTFGDQEMATFLNDSGLGSHPKVLSFLVNLAKTMGEDTVVKGSPPQPKVRDKFRDPLETLFDKKPLQE